VDGPGSIAGQPVHSFGSPKVTRPSRASMTSTAIASAPKSHRELAHLLIQVMDRGCTTGRERRAIEWIKGL